ncbi:hypothetical protein GOP47_0012752 [Adiantum capillus-veneris]|uniref:Polyphenol oxidase C-terminal domain-containing protein n=1 Tax=Adiantum capillus-veneris TaxID=13818 RepID=A0A9D4URW3_ADICA|nr:hypothetical protein GOP47_0012752 [Adiantum capillus-veneris]
MSVLVKRPKKVRADDYEEEILVFEGVEVPANEKVKFDVYINLSEEELEELESEDGDERKGQCDISEYAGSFFNIPHLGKTEIAPGKKVRKSNFKLGIGEVLKELGLEEEDSFIVTIIPRTSSTLPISIQDVIIEYE